MMDNGIQFAELLGSSSIPCAAQTGVSLSAVSGLNSYVN